MSAFWSGHAGAAAGCCSQSGGACGCCCQRGVRFGAGMPVPAAAQCSGRVLLEVLLSEACVALEKAA